MIRDVVALVSVIAFSQSVAVWAEIAAWLS